MISMTLFKKEWKSNWILLLIFMGVLTMYSVIIVSMFNPEAGDSLRAMAESMPEVFAAFGMLDVGTTLLEFVTGYLYGMLLIAFPAVYLIILSNRLVARYVDQGSMAYLLATPVKRKNCDNAGRFYDNDLDYPGNLCNRSDCGGKSGNVSGRTGNRRIFAGKCWRPGTLDHVCGALFSSILCV